MTPELEALAQRLEEAEKQIAHLTTLVFGKSDADRTVVAKQFVVRDGGWPPFEFYLRTIAHDWMMPIHRVNGE
jgi:hypothetical protein